MDKMIYKIPVVWSMMGYVFVEARNEYEAMQYAKDHIDDFEIPTDGRYLDDSFEVDMEGIAWPV